MNKRQCLKWMCSAIGLSLACYVAYELPTGSQIWVQRSERRLVPPPNPNAAEQRQIRDHVVSLLNKIERLRLERHPEEGSCKFLEPAKENEILAIEEYSGARLPEDFRAYLELHDGQDRRSSFYGYQPLLSCKEILSQSKDLLSIFSAHSSLPLNHQGDWYHPAALIFEERDGGGYAINALNGKVYSWDHDGGSLRLKANSFTDFLEVLVACLEAGDGPNAALSKWDRERN